MAQPCHRAVRWGQGCSRVPSLSRGHCWLKPGTVALASVMMSSGSPRKTAQKRAAGDGSEGAELCGAGCAPRARSAAPAAPVEVVPFGHTLPHALELIQALSCHGCHLHPFPGPFPAAPLRVLVLCAQTRGRVAVGAPSCLPLPLVRTGVTPRPSFLPRWLSSFLQYPLSQVSCWQGQKHACWFFICVAVSGATFLLFPVCLGSSQGSWLFVKPLME